MASADRALTAAQSSRGSSAGSRSEPTACEAS
eukprot:CAMPEP_0173168908 /NCGR_PEP_ID=MMETSP1141-20130122/408_1 /TAXON_ID=483371 /ORGANISM="non described non described, Strain CCMP2298" /LENGTH=31 /DNA_ID= /DNA_START= /DNA_END= /DNA_ORIENTATION=